MSEQIVFYFVFLSQVLLISYYFPRKVLRRVRHVLDTYPPAQYPRLYPVPVGRVEQARRIYRNMNLLALLIGLVLLSIGIYSPGEELLFWDSAALVSIYGFVQFAPLILATLASLSYLSRMRKADSRTTRKAELHPRRLFDFVSPALLGLAIFVYVAFVLLILYVRQFEFPWFGGYLNIVGVTALNLFFAGVIIHYLYGKKSNPYQAHEDRIREIGISVRVSILVSILGTAFIALNVAVRAFDMQNLIPIWTSLYFQLVVLISFSTFRLNNIDFEVYKENPLVA